MRGRMRRSRRRRLGPRLLLLLQLLVLLRLLLSLIRYLLVRRLNLLLDLLTLLLVRLELGRRALGNLLLTQLLRLMQRHAFTTFTLANHDRLLLKEPTPPRPRATKWPSPACSPSASY